MSEITPYWESVNATIQDEVLATNTDAFLQNPTLKLHVVTGYDADRIAQQWPTIADYFGVDRACQILDDEPEFGHPDLIEFKGVRCSPNSIQTLYHLAHWSATTDTDVTDLNTVIEWGGGYGAMARLVLKINPELEYFMIDTPTFTQLQYNYLIYGLRLPTVYTHEITQLEELDGIQADLFISTWALSESPRSAITLAATLSPIKNAEHVLLAYQQSQDEFEAAGEVVDILNAERELPITQINPVSYTQGSDWYATR